MTVTRYHPVLVALHWLTGLMIFANLGFGYFAIGKMENTNPEKLKILAVHMGVGTAVIALMAVRLIVRFITSHPEPSAHQKQGAGRLRTPVHLALYAVILITAGAGWLTGYQIAHLYETPGNTLPADFPQMGTRVVHVWMALVLFLLILLHIAAAIRERATGDRSVLSRMGFGKRTA